MALLDVTKTPWPAADRGLDAPPEGTAVNRPLNLRRPIRRTPLGDGTFQWTGPESTATATDVPVDETGQPTGRFMQTQASQAHPEIYQAQAQSDRQRMLDLQSDIRRAQMPGLLNLALSPYQDPGTREIAEKELQALRQTEQQAQMQGRLATQGGTQAFDAFGNPIMSTVTYDKAGNVSVKESPQPLPRGEITRNVTIRAGELMQSGVAKTWAQALTMASQEATQNILAPRAGETAGAAAGARTQAGLDVGATPENLEKRTEIARAGATGTTQGTISTRAQNYGLSEVQRGNRIFDTELGRDVTTAVGSGSVPFDNDKMVSIPKEKAADLQLALARRNSYLKLSNQIEQDLGQADDLFQRGQISSTEWAKRTTGSSVLWKKIAALNDHALTSMRVLTGGAPRSEMMLEISKEAFGNISPGTSKEVLAQARDNFLTQMDEQIKGYQYGLQAPTTATTGGATPPAGPPPPGATHWSPTKGYLDAQGNPIGRT